MTHGFKSRIITGSSRFDSRFLSKFAQGAIVVNGKSDGQGLIIPMPKQSDPPKELTCHRFFAPVVVPEPDKLNPARLNITPRLGNFNCLKERCMLWNADKQECWDLTALKGQALAGEYAYAKMNDVHIEGTAG